ncbi:MAG TPA: hypothetical protein VF126_10220 [Acidobacteriaceae bacterium]
MNFTCSARTSSDAKRLRNGAPSAAASTAGSPCSSPRTPARPSLPVIPAFYNEPATTAEMVRNFVDRVLAHFGLPKPGAFVWKPS